MSLAALCQFAYLLAVLQLPSYDMRVLGYSLFGLVQLFYLFPLAVFYKKRDEGLTSNGVIITGALSLLGAAAWCAYAAVASVIILAYFWKSSGVRPFRYAELL